MKIKVMKAYFDVLYYKSVQIIMNERKSLFENMVELSKIVQKLNPVTI